MSCSKPALGAHRRGRIRRCLKCPHPTRKGPRLWGVGGDTQKPPCALQQCVQLREGQGIGDTLGALTGGPRRRGRSPQGAARRSRGPGQPGSSCTGPVLSTDTQGLGPTAGCPRTLRALARHRAPHPAAHRRQAPCRAQRLRGRRTRQPAKATNSSWPGVCSSSPSTRLAPRGPRHLGPPTVRHRACTPPPHQHPQPLGTPPSAWQHPWHPSAPCSPMAPTRTPWHLHGPMAPISTLWHLHAPTPPSTHQCLTAPHTAPQHPTAPTPTPSLPHSTPVPGPLTTWARRG